MDPQPPDQPQPSIGSEEQLTLNTSEKGSALAFVDSREKVIRQFDTLLQGSNSLFRALREKLRGIGGDENDPRREGELIGPKGERLTIAGGPLNILHEGEYRPVRDLQELAQLQAEGKDIVVCNRLKFSDRSIPDRQIEIYQSSDPGSSSSWSSQIRYSFNGHYFNLNDDFVPHYDSLPDRDPLDAVREGLDYFLQHADELKLVEPNQGGQTQPTPGIPLTQPAPSV